MNRLYVLPTINRNGAKDDYIVRVNSSVKKRMHLEKFAVVVFDHPNINRKLKVPCRIIVDNTVDGTQARVDQTLRNAIGIPFEYDESRITIKIYPLRLCWSQLFRDFISHKFGRRYLFFRVCKATIPDLEKNLCRIPFDAFRLLGCEVGDNIVCDSIVFEENLYKLKVHKLKAYGASEEMISRREEMEKADVSARFPSAEKLLNVSPDIPPIFFDAHLREILHVDSIDPVRVRRDLLDLFFKQVREFGIIFFLSILAVAEVFPEVSWQLLFLMLPLSFLVAFLLILLNIRAKVR